MKKTLSAWGILLALLLTTAPGQEPCFITVPLDGLAGPDGEMRVARELSRIEHVSTVSIDRNNGVFVMEEGHGLHLTAVIEALAKANARVKSDVGGRCSIGDPIRLSEIHLFQTRRTVGAGSGDLEAELRRLPGFKEVRLYNGGFAPTFVGKLLPTVDQVKETASKEAGYAVVDLVLAPSRDGVRYGCRVHPDKAAADPVRCPVCSTGMERVAASREVGEASLRKR